MGALGSLLATTLLVAVLGLYSWRRREVPGARYFAVACFFWTMSLVGGAAEATAVDLAVQIAWHTFQSLWQLPIVTAVACFSLDYVQPGRWLTRRRLALLAAPPLVFGLLILTNATHHLFWRGFVLNGGEVHGLPAPAGWLAVAYAVLLASVQAAALLWLFAHSPPHRWPVALMLAALVLTRTFFVLAIIDRSRALPPEGAFLLALFPAASYAIALFGFKIFDPMPAARTAVLAQMSAGVIVFDVRQRVISLNPAAEAMLGLHSGGARGRSWVELAPAAPPLSAPDAQSPGAPSEFALDHAGDVRWYAAAHSPLYDFRGLCVGCLLLLHDVTTEHRTQAQLMAQQRSLAALHERERLARDLHDGVAQVISYASLQAEAARHLIDIGQGATAAAQLARLAAVLQEAHADVRGEIKLLCAAPAPPPPFFTAVRHFLDSFTDSYAIATRLTIAPGLGEARLAPETQAQLLHILQEALANTRKHSRARCVQVAFTAANDVLQMCVTDDGVGFVPEIAAGGDGHWGLRFMRERAAELGGGLHIAAQPGAGAGVVVEIPWKEG